MFWSSPSGDLQVIIALLIIAIAISLVVYFKTKKVFLSVFLFSIIANLIAFGNITYRFADYYNVFWLFKFVRTVWPYINILLLLVVIFNFIKNKNAETK
jgi:hypothetical protein